LTIDNLHELFPFDTAEYRRTRSALAATYVSILKGANLAFDERLTALCEAEEDSEPEDTELSLG
jgi:hypothetical protein